MHWKIMAERKEVMASRLRALREREMMCLGERGLFRKMCKEYMREDRHIQVTTVPISRYGSTQSGFRFGVQPSCVIICRL